MKTVMLQIAGKELGKVLKNGVLVPVNMITKNPNIQNIFERAPVKEKKTLLRSNIILPLSTPSSLLPLCMPAPTHRAKTLETTTHGLPLLHVNSLFISRKWGK